MATTITYTGTLRVTECWCGITYAAPADLLRRAHNEGVSIYCPQGHRCVWSETEEQRLRKRLDAAEGRVSSMLAQRDQAQAEADHQAAVARGYKGALVKTKKRIGRGVCPCCNRHFADVERHMACKHPEVASS